MENKNHVVTWHIPINDYKKISALADNQKRSVQNMALVLLNKGIDDEQITLDNQTLERELAELKGVEIISGCINTEQLKGATRYINLFNMGFGSSEILNDVYKAKKQLIIN